MWQDHKPRLTKAEVKYNTESNDEFMMRQNEGGEEQVLLGRDKRCSLSPFPLQALSRYRERKGGGIGSKRKSVVLHING